MSYVTKINRKKLLKKPPATTIENPGFPRLLVISFCPKVS